MQYNGGPVVKAHSVYLLFWQGSAKQGYTFDSDYRGLIEQFFADVAHDSATGPLGATNGNVYSVAGEYYDSAGHIPYSSTVGGSFLDTSPFPKSGCPLTPAGALAQLWSVCVSDDQITAELARFIKNNHLPTGNQALYFVLTPSGVGSCFDSAGQTCFSFAYCGYHSVAGKSNSIIYANLPYVGDFVLCTPFAGPNGNLAADGEINVISHEHNEMITDPFGTGWWVSDPVPGSFDGGEEEADKCAWQFATFGDANQTINGHSYLLQEEFSNADNGCDLGGQMPLLDPGNPSSGGVGDAVTVRGSNFTPDAIVTVGGVAADFTFVDASELDVTIPDGATSGFLSVATDRGVAEHPFDVDAGLNGFAPSSAAVGGTITISGSSFTSDDTVSFTAAGGGLVAATTNFVNATTLRATVPANAASGPVTVSFSGGESATSSDPFFVLPTIGRFTPASGVPGGTHITLNGTGLSSVGEVVLLGSSAAVSAANLAIDSPTSLEFDVPADAQTGKLRLVDATVGGVPGPSVDSAVVFTTQIGIASFTPTSASEGDTIHLTGAGFTPDTSVRINKTLVPAQDYTYVDPNHADIQLPGAATSGPINVTSGGESGTSAQQLTVVPQLTGLEPDNGPAGTTVTLHGLSLVGVSSVSFGTATARFKRISPEVIQATVPPTATSGAIVIGTGKGSPPIETPLSFTVGPAITSFKPTQGIADTAVTVNGTGFGASDASRVLELDGIPIADVTWVSPTQLSFVVPVAATSGSISIAVGGGATATSAASFTVLPSISGYDVQSARIGDPVTIEGSALAATSIVRFGKVAQADFTVASDGLSITTTVPAGATSAAVTVTTPAGNAKGPLFMVEPSLDPLSISVANAGATVTLTGQALAGTRSVMFAGANGPATVPARFKASATSLSITVPQAATTGAIEITTDGGSVDSTSVGIQPTIGRYKPAAGTVGSTVTLTGSGFGAPGETRTIAVNGAEATDVTYISPNQLSFTVPDGATTGPITIAVGGLPPFQTTSNFTVVPSSVLRHL